MAQLLNRRSDGIIVIPQLVQALAKSFNALAMEILLTRRSGEVQITEVVKAAVANDSNGQQVMALLLKQRGDEVQITEEVLKEAASNEAIGHKLVQLLH
jgi:uncharacterized protein YrzB (UPF0473 family)